VRRSRAARKAAPTLLLLLLAACGSLPDIPEPPAQPEKPFAQVGTASWYGPWHHGRRTANGERFDMHAMTAAHRELPLGTRVLVTNLENQRAVQVRINDRGPYIRGRILDLSAAAARALGMRERGLATVRIETLGSRGREAPTAVAAEDRSINQGN